MVHVRLSVCLLLKRYVLIPLLLCLMTSSTYVDPHNASELEECAKSRSAADFVLCINQTFPDGKHLTNRGIFASIQGLTCKGQCGILTPACSCRPTCVSAGSCCDDFFEECPTEVDRLNNGLQWLRHVKMTCTRNLVYFIKTCPVPGSTLDKLVRKASLPDTEPHAKQPQAFSESEDKPYETSANSEMVTMQTNDTSKFSILNMSYDEDRRVTINDDNTSIRSTASNAISQSRIHGTSWTTVNPKETLSDLTGGASTGKSSSLAHTRDIKIGDDLRSPDIYSKPVSAGGEEFHNKISVDFKQTYVNAPVTDADTGVVFANSSIFDCYSSVTGDRIYWEYEFDPVGNDLINITMTDMLQQFASDIKKQRILFIAPQQVKIPPERCIYRAVEKCPRNNVFGPGCARSMGYVMISDSMTYYRNPFCSACHTTDWSSIHYVDPLQIWGQFRTVAEFRITMLPGWNKVRFVASFRPQRRHFLAPLWNEITCEEDGALALTSMKITALHRIGNQICRIVSCRAGVLKNGNCYVETDFAIDVPCVSGQPIVDDFTNLSDCIMKLKKDIIEAFTYVVPSNTPEGPTIHIKIFVSGFVEFTLDWALQELILDVVWAKVQHLGISPYKLCVSSGGRHVTINWGLMLCWNQRRSRYKDHCRARGWAITGSPKRVSYMWASFLEKIGLAIHLRNHSRIQPWSSQITEKTSWMNTSALVLFAVVMVWMAIQ